MIEDVTTYVFRNDLLQCRPQYLPGKYLDILLDIPGLRGGEAHNSLEELLAFGLRLTDGQRPKALQVAADAVLLLNAEPVRRHDELFEKRDSVDARDEALALLVPVDAANANTVGWPLADGHGLKRC
ncbi:hypothetical protein RRF57_009450 [Xylaria bambusicola]|uniref:Uncharacterized protein n=1 Tax=Xylaria bambusicola TaxID=326684 RepID=A0AAN7UVK6_9PEZI